MRIAIKTLGCKSNRYESDKLFDSLKGRYEIFEMNEGASTFQQKVREGVDVFVVNTCTVTQVADRKSRQAVRSLKKMNPKCRVVVFGCGSNVGKEKYEGMEEVDKVAGNVEEVVDFLAELGVKRLVSMREQILSMESERVLS